MRTRVFEGVSYPGGCICGMDNRIGRISEVATSQHGVFSRAQALGAGFSIGAIDHRVLSGQWLVLHEGVYAIGGCPLTPQATLRAALLKMGDGAVASHTSAAWASGLLKDLIVPVHVTSPLPSRSIPGVAFHRRNLGPHEIQTVQGIDATATPRTLLDMWALTPALSDAVMDAALRRKMTTVNELSAFLRATARQGVPGVRRLRAATLERALDPKMVESPLERRFLKLVRRSDLPPPAIQHEVIDDFGTMVRLDFAYPECKLAIEVDGYAFHSNNIDWLRDRRKMNLLAKMGWTVIHVTKHDLDSQSLQIIATIKGFLNKHAFSSTRTSDSRSV